MNFLEFFVFTLYLSTLVGAIVAIQYFQPGKQVPELIEVQETEEHFDEKEFEEPLSDSSEDEYTMTENPMFRHRKQVSMLEMVD